jgi:hypothetical protein
LGSTRKNGSGLAALFATAKVNLDTKHEKIVGYNQDLYLFLSETFRSQQAEPYKSKWKKNLGCSQHFFYVLYPRQLMLETRL